MSDTITTTGPNVGRLLGLGRWLTEQERRRRMGKPSEWDQNVWVRTEDYDSDEHPVKVVQDGDEVVIEGWSCGTAACAAGHVSLEDGGRPVFSWGGDKHPVPPVAEYGYDDVWGAVADTISSSEMIFDNRVESIDEHAMRALGLTQDQANRLFHGDNTWDTMTYLIAQFTGMTQEQLVTLVGGDDLPPEPEDDDDSEW